MNTHTLIRLALFAVLLATTLSPRAAARGADDKLRVYVGTYTGTKSKGIYLGELDPASGTLTIKGLAGESFNPSFVALHPSNKFLYAVSEIDSFDKKKTGGVSAFGAYLLAENQGSDTIVVFRIDAKTGALKQVGAPVSVPGPVCVRFAPLEK